MGLILCMGLALPFVAEAAAAVPSRYRIVGAEQDIPYTVLYAVALTESGRTASLGDPLRPWPWTLNVAGKGYYFDSRNEAWHALTAHLEAGRRSIDIGLMQVNWQYHRQRLGSPWRALDPWHNLRTGAAILKDCYTRLGNWWLGLGCYHAPHHPQRAKRYRKRVLSHWQRILP